MSFLVVLTIMAYAAFKMVTLIERQQPTISSYLQRGEITPNDALNLRKAGMNFAFGVEGFLDGKVKDDPRYVKLMLRYHGVRNGN